MNFGHNKGLITFTMITLSVFHCNYLRPHQALLEHIRIKRGLKWPLWDQALLIALTVITIRFGTWGHDRVEEHDGEEEGDGDADHQTQTKFHFWTWNIRRH